MREQNLRGPQAMRGEGVFIDLHQAHLAYCRGRAQLVLRARSGFPAQALHAFGHRAR